MGEEEIITQLGLLFTQMRLARRALDSIERNTASYRGVAFATALTAGRQFGEPPLLNGALKVYVVNINDLTASSGGFLEGLLGGVGRFLGGTIGGLIGGTIGGIALPYNLTQFARITASIDSILNRLGIGGSASSSSSGSSGGSSLATMLPRLTATIDALTNMFRTGTAPTQPTAQAGGAAMPILPMLQAASGLVNGLILLVPILTGAFASLLLRIDDIKLAIIDMLQFALRLVFLLRGVALVTIYDTIAAAARLGANMLSIIGTAMTGILGSIFRIVGTLLTTVVEALRFVSNGIKNTIDALMIWLRDGLGNLLIFLGDTRVFRLIFHLVDILPLVLPALHSVIHGAPLPPAAAAALTVAATRPVPGPGVVGGPGGVIAPFPNLADTLLPPAEIARMTTAVTSAGAAVTTEMRGIFGTAQGALNSIGAAMNQAVTTGETNFNRDLQGHLNTVTNRAGQLADALSTARAEAAIRPQTGLDAIARAYEGWLSGGGFTTLMGRITDHFSRTPTVGADVATSIPGQVVTSVGTAASRARATVEIGEVTIEIEPPPTLDLQTQPPIYEAQFDLDTWQQQQHELEDRGGITPAFA
ncbi:MAG: hypothetical protein LC803_22595 [Acidobacteria bacterium]|nr:hypothetical protein [Acidobacteriota bacterium]